jgi:hypothetical protein
MGGLSALTLAFVGARRRRRGLGRTAAARGRGDAVKRRSHYRGLGKSSQISPEDVFVHCRAPALAECARQICGRLNLAARLQRLVAAQCTCSDNSRTSVRTRTRAGMTALTREQCPPRIQCTRLPQQQLCSISNKFSIACTQTNEHVVRSA